MILLFIPQIKSPLWFSYLPLLPQSPQHLSIYCLHTCVFFWTSHGGTRLLGQILPSDQHAWVCGELLWERQVIPHLLGVLSIVQRMNNNSRGWQQSEHLISKNSAMNRWYKTYCKIRPEFISLSKFVEWTRMPTNRKIMKLCIKSAIFTESCSWIYSNTTRLFSKARYTCWLQWMFSLNSECTDSIDAQFSPTCCE